MLQKTVNIIKNCLSRDDIIVRMGGDEFYIVLNTDERLLLESTVQQIKEQFDIF